MFYFLEECILRSTNLGKKDYPREEKDGEIGKLKRHIRHLEKENSRLKSELRTYERVFNKNIKFLKERTENLSLDDLLKGAQQELSLQQIKEDKVQKFEDLERKWRCFKCSHGIMKLIIIPKGTGSNYFRRCTICENRTEIKEYSPEVEGIR